MGEESRDYYEKAMQVFQQLVDLLDKQITPDLFDKMRADVENTIGLAGQATGWASGYDEWLQDTWERCKWFEI